MNRWHTELKYALCVARQITMEPPCEAEQPYGKRKEGGTHHSTTTYCTLPAKFLTMLVDELRDLRRGQWLATSALVVIPPLAY